MQTGLFDQNLTQRQIIFRYLRSLTHEVLSYDLQKVNTPFGWLGTSADREARRMAEEGILLRSKQGRYAVYRINPMHHGEV